MPLGGDRSNMDSFDIVFTSHSGVEIRDSGWIITLNWRKYMGIM
jgi:hypothetical protein